MGQYFETCPKSITCCGKLVGASEFNICEQNCPEPCPLFGHKFLEGRLQALGCGGSD